MHIMLLCRIMKIIASNHISEVSSTYLLDLKCCIGLEDIPTIMSVINNCLNDNKNNIFLDLSDVECMEKDVWFCLIDIKSYIKKLGGNIFVSNISGFVKDEFYLLGLDNDFSLFSEVEGII